MSRLLVTVVLVLSLLANAVAAPLALHGRADAGGSPASAEAAGPAAVEATHCRGHAAAAAPAPPPAGDDHACCDRDGCGCGCAAPSNFASLGALGLRLPLRIALPVLTPPAAVAMRASPPLRPPAA